MSNSLGPEQHRAQRRPFKNVWKGPEEKQVNEMHPF